MLHGHLISSNFQLSLPDEDIDNDQSYKSSVLFSLEYIGLRLIQLKHFFKSF